MDALQHQQQGVAESCCTVRVGRSRPEGGPRADSDDGVILGNQPNCIVGASSIIG